MVRTFKYMTLLLLMPVCSSVVLAQVGLSIHDTSAFSSSKLTVPIYVDSSLTGKNVTSFQIELGYDTYYMAFDSVITAGSQAQSIGSVNYNSMAPGTITIAAAGSSPLSGAGILVYVRFRLRNAGSTTISFLDGSANNFLNERNPAVVLHDGSVSIAAAPSITLYPFGGLMAVGDQQQYNAYYGTAPYHWSLTNASAASIDANGLLTATHTGFTRVIVSDEAGTVDTISGIVEVRAFRLSVRDTSYVQGQTFNLPVYATNLTGLNVSSGYFQIQYNPDYFTPTGVVQGGTLLSSYSAPVFSISPTGTMNISFAGVVPLSGSGVLVYVQCKVSKTNSGSATIYPADIVFNESIQGDSTSGNFQTVNLANLTVMPLVANLIDGDTLRFTVTGGTSPYTWSTSDATIGSMNSSGLLTALKGGSVTVHAVDAYGGTGASNMIEVYDTRAFIPDTAGVIGDTIDIPLSLSPVNAGMRIQSIQATVTFDSSVVHPVGVFNAGSITNGWTFSTNISGTQFSFAAATAANLNLPGIVCKLRFAVPSYAASGRIANITLQQFLLNEGRPRVLIVSGSIQTTSVGLPAAPTSLNAEAINSGRIDLSWHDNAENETGYSVERATNSTSAWIPINTLAANSNSYSDDGLNDGTKYFYRVFATNTEGSSNSSNVAVAVTPMQTPSNLTGTQIVGGAIQLTWQDNSGSELGYYIERKKNFLGTYTVKDSVLSNISEYTDATGVPGNEYFYRIRGYNSVATSAYSNEVNVTLTGIKSDGTALPDRFAVSQNYPNPFNPSTVIMYQVPVNSLVTLKVYDVLGKEIQTLVNKHMSAGFYSATFVASTLPSGVYFYRMQAGKFSETRKLMVVK